MPRAATETLDDLIYAAGIPLTLLAKKARISDKTLLDLRRGTWAVPRVATLTKLAKVLGVEVLRLRAACKQPR